MRKLRDVFYINANPLINEFVYYGLEFKEFIKFIPKAESLKNILLIDAEYYGTNFSEKYKFTIVDENEIDELLSDDIYGYGNFTWVDVNDKNSIEKLEPAEVAELLYLGYMLKPVTTPFNDKIQNRYAYLAHDDGWFCRLYCRIYSDFIEVVSNKIVNMVLTSRRVINPISDDIKKQLLVLAENGLLIDFSNIMKYNRGIEIPIYTIGKFLDMDEMYNNLKRNIERANYSAKLIYKNKEWKIEYICQK